MKVVVTGKVAGESRATAEQKLREAGHEVQPAVNAETDVLLTGERVGATKTNKATALGVQVMPWEAFWSVPSTDVVVIDADGVGTGRLTADEHGDIVVLDSPMVEELMRPIRQIGPMLAKADELPLGPDWMYELKFDGWRCVATVREGQVSMQSRSGKSELSGQYPHIAEALVALGDCIVDGELVSVDETGQDRDLRPGSEGLTTVYVVWDLLELGDGDMRMQPLSFRREMLEGLLQATEAGANGLVQLSPAFEDGQVLLDWCAENGREGLVAKRLSGKYVEGHRGWVKVKCRNEQEFVIVGWTPGNGANEGRRGGALLAYWQDGELVYCGRVGTRPEADAELEAMTPRATSPLGVVPKGKIPKAASWVEPELVVQVLFQRWTEDGCLWHPIWKTLRSDKAVEEVTRQP